MEPLPAELELTAHLTNLEYQGFTVIPDAIPRPLLKRVQAAFHAAAASATPGQLEFSSDLHKTPAALIDGDGVVEITQPYEHHPDLQQLLELPRPMAVLEGLLGERAIVDDFPSLFWVVLCDFGRWHRGALAAARARRPGGPASGCAGYRGSSRRQRRPVLFDERARAAAGGRL